MSDGSDRLHGWLTELDRVGSCARPVRIAVIREGAPQDDRVILVTCKDRRAVVCPACSHTYKGDAWQVVASGLRGGKGVTAEVGRHPRVFLTLTAPSFGPVHSGSVNQQGAQVCHRSRKVSCPHGVRSDCHIVHEADDPLLGQPLCARCFDYPGAILWNAHVAVLWQRTAKRALRRLERMGDVGEGGLRLSYVKAAEFQRRGLVHLHVVLRADGDEGPEAPPPAWVNPERMVAALSEVAPRVTTQVPNLGGTGSSTIGWGIQMAASELGRADSTDELGDDRQLAVAAYAAKYATKTADTTGALAYRIRSATEIGGLAVNDHQRRLVETAWTLGGYAGLRHLRLRRCAHAFGYRGHVVTKSHLYSTTFTALRASRADYARNNGEGGIEPEGDARFGYAGRGYDDPELGLLAFHLARLATVPSDAPANREVVP
jgi:uncharacterized Zn-finger protein